MGEAGALGEASCASPAGVSSQTRVNPAAGAFTAVTPRMSKRTGSRSGSWIVMASGKRTPP